MNEVLVFNDTLGLMLFDNDWQQINVDIKKNNTQDFSLIYGGGTHAINISLKKLEHIDFELFKKQEIDGLSSFTDKYQEYKIFELPKEGILLRAGADHIFFAIGSGTDRFFSKCKELFIDYISVLQ